MTHYLDDVFASGGFLSRRFPGYEPRPGQVALARLVDQAMTTGRHALGEAPCGTGKGVAYGVPAVWHAHHRRKRVVIATANIALQEQLVTKDLPLLAEVLPWSFKFSLLKGRGNYLCLDRLDDVDEPGLAQDEVSRQVAYLKSWAENTKTGDVSEVPFVPASAAWSRFSVGADECKGEDCEFFKDCFVERAKAVAAQSEIVVTNHHLLCAHLAVRQITREDLVLPKFDFLVVDEAHELADIARDFFGWTLSEPMIMRLASSAASFGQYQIASDLRREGPPLFGAAARLARSPAYKCRLKAPFYSGTNLVVALADLTQRAAAVEGYKLLPPEKRAEAGAIRRRAESAMTSVREVTSLSDANKVYFIDLDSHGRASLGAKMTRVGNLLRTGLFEKTESVTLVSATLSAGGSFDFIRSEVGIPQEAAELVADSPFNFAKQAMLVLPIALPDPRDEQFVAAAASAVQQVIDACNGRTLALFTSHKNMNAVHEKIANNGYRVLRQGQMPRTELTRIFKEDISSVLLGTDSFWTGIDVPGEALTAVVIDKLPFPRLDDPVVDAIQAADTKAFFTYMVPRAIIMLRQGVGRLIRSQKDVGVVVILDKRIIEKGYGSRFLHSLPPMPTTRWIQHIRPFLAGASARRAA